MTPEAPRASRSMIEVPQPRVARGRCGVATRSWSMRRCTCRFSSGAAICSHGCRVIRTVSCQRRTCSPRAAPGCHARSRHFGHGEQGAWCPCRHAMHAGTSSPSLPDPSVAPRDALRPGHRRKARALRSLSDAPAQPQCEARETSVAERSTRNFVVPTRAMPETGREPSHSARNALVRRHSRHPQPHPGVP